MARTKKADRLAATPPTRKQMWVYTDKWVELHSEVERLKAQLKSERDTHRLNTSMWRDDLERLYNYNQIK
jgi:hypothetical protein